MPAPSINEYWVERVNSHLSKSHSAGRRPSPTGIHKSLVAEFTRMDRAKRAELGKPPSQRSIDRIRVRNWDLKSPEEKVQYQEFSWPGSMECGELPWAASSAALELLGLRHQWNHGRPSIRLVRWFWHVTQAAPDLPLLPIVPPWPADSKEIDPPGRYDIACHLSAWEAGTKAPQWHKSGIEAYLAYAPWRSDLHKSKYHLARQTKSPQGPIPPLPPLRLDLAAGREAWSDAYGNGNAEKMAPMAKTKAAALELIEEEE